MIFTLYDGDDQMSATETYDSYEGPCSECKILVGKSEGKCKAQMQKG